MDVDRRSDHDSRDRIGQIDKQVKETVGQVNEHVKNLPGWRRELSEWQKMVEDRLRRVLFVMVVVLVGMVVGAVVVVVAGRSLARQSSQQAETLATSAAEQARAAQQLAALIQQQRVDSLVFGCTEATKRNLQAKRKLRGQSAQARAIGGPLIDALAPARSRAECLADALKRVPPAPSWQQPSTGLSPGAWWLVAPTIKSRPTATPTTPSEP